MCEARDQCRTVQRFEFVKIGTVDDAGDDFADVVGLAGIFRNNTIEFFCWKARLNDLLHRDRRYFFAVQMPNNFTRNAQRVFVVLGQMIGHTRGARMDIAATQFFCRDDFACRCFHQRRASQKNRTLIFDDDRFVAHCGHIRATRSTRAHHTGDLRNAFRTQIRLVIKNATEMITIRKNFILQR